MYIQSLLMHVLWLKFSLLLNNVCILGNPPEHLRIIRQALLIQTVCIYVIMLIYIVLLYLWFWGNKLNLIELKGINLSSDWLIKQLKINVRKNNNVIYFLFLLEKTGWPKNSQFLSLVTLIVALFSHCWFSVLFIRHFKMISVVFFYPKLI